MEKYIKVSDLLNSKLIFPGFPSELVEEEIEKLSIDVTHGFLIKVGDEVNSFLVAALRSLNQEQMVILRDKAIEYTKSCIELLPAEDVYDYDPGEVINKLYSKLFSLYGYLQSLNQ